MHVADKSGKIHQTRWNHDMLEKITGTQLDTPKRSIAKTISWRLFSVIITFCVSFLITRKIAIAVSISLVDTLVKLIAYYYHERIWTSVNWGRYKYKYRKPPDIE